MTSETRWDAAKRLFEAALAVAPSARDAYLRQACGDDEALLAEVQSLLTWHGDTTGFLETPAARVRDLSLVAASAAEMLGTAVGAWRITDIIGHGGMGVVYRAERADAAFQRRAAIKVVRPGPDLPQIVDRFRLERETLAALDHPNIARLLDGGTTADGQPYFVMELIEGIPIDKYCDLHRLTISQRLALFRQICAGVRYAHENVVVHRDIKPDNILVNKDGVPKLLDFGVSKIVSRDVRHVAEADGPAVAATWLMTPDYASPEQLGGRPSTTATDVYSLGVLLYVLLTGVRPYHLTGTTPADIQTELRAAVLVPPSARVLHGEDADARAASRASTPARLARRLAGDLDAIVLRALAATPASRYSSIEQLVHDLENHRTAYPVAARGRDRWYVVRTFVKRHHVALSVATSMLLLSIAGVAGILWQASIAAEARLRAERRFNEVRQLAGAFMFDVYDSIVEVPGATPARNLIVKTTVRYLESLAREAEGDLTLQRELARAFVRVGDVQGNPTNPNLGDTTGALTNYRRAIAIIEDVRRVQPRDREVMRTLALAHRRLGDVLALRGDKTAALGEAETSQRLFAQIAAAPDPTLDDRIEAGIAFIKLGDVLGNPNFQHLGRAQEAEQQYAAALAAFRTLATVPTSDFRVRRFVGLTLERIGTMHEASRRWPDARQAYEESFAIRRALAAEQPTHQNIQRDLAIAYEKLGNVRGVTDGPAAAVSSYREALAQFERLARADPSNENAAISVAISREKLARTELEVGERAAAVELLRGALATHHAVTVRDPRNTRATCDAARVAELLAGAQGTRPPAGPPSAVACEQ